MRAVRSVSLVSRRLGLYGVADVVEFDENDTTRPLRPVEYKVGRPKVEDWDCVQLAAQTLCLEEMYGVRIAEADLFYGQTRHRTTVPIGDELRLRVEALAQRAHELAEMRGTPKGNWTSRCRRCSLVNECSPTMFSRDIAAYWESRGAPLEVRE